MSLFLAIQIWLKVIGYIAFDKMWWKVGEYNRTNGISSLRLWTPSPRVVRPVRHVLPHPSQFHRNSNSSSIEESITNFHHEEACARQLWESKGHHIKIELVLRVHQWLKVEATTEHRGLEPAINNELMSSWFWPSPYFIDNVVKSLCHKGNRCSVEGRWGFGG